MSCLQALDHLKFDHPIIEEIISKLMSLKASGFDIHLCWLPGHVGILGNERADRAAKAARRTDMQPCLIPPSDFKPIIRKHITAMWQATWDESPLNKLHEIAPIVNEPRTHHLSTRRDQSVFNRCRIGHSRLTHEFLLKGEPPPECIPCNSLAFRRTVEYGLGMKLRKTHVKFCTFLKCPQYHFTVYFFLIFV